ncbi:MAG: DEAD/DEAH box helicase [Nitrososphaerota archaeon]|nr:DEAD/DEAH box helicase [Nitrososphaerota archaeon]
MEYRRYQLEVSNIASGQNTLVVLPTGLGKTAVALLVIANYLSKDISNRALVLAPTRVLVHQHHSFLSKYLNVDIEEIGVLTGEDSEELRKKTWSKRVVCATPQVTVSDVDGKRCRLEEFSVVVIDEAHRAIGNHSYTTIAAVYNEFKKDGRLLGLTASLPSDRSKIEEIISKLKIAKVEVRDEKDDDVKPYVYKTDVEWKEIDLSPTLKTIQSLTRTALNGRLKLLEDASLIKRTNYGSITLKDLLNLRMKVDQIQSSQLKTALFSGIRLFHALNLLETQTLSSYVKFMDRLMDRRRGYGMSELLNDQNVKESYEQARAALLNDHEHPKIAETLKLVENVKNGERAIVFASYRDTVEQIYKGLRDHGFKVGFLIGKSGKSGQSQKAQLRALEDLRSGVYDILVATQVGEEGLDVAECNIVIFYDNVPSAVRFIQRKGRTGRKKEGHMYVLVTKGTKDEAYYWMSRRRVSDTKKIIAQVVGDKAKTGPLDRFVTGSSEENKPLVYADTREIAELVEWIRQRGARVEVKQLDFGDFVLSNEIVIERKTLDDFVKSIYDGRLFKQLVNMNEKYSRPILVVQGDRKHLSGIGESAFYGALASVLSDFKVPIFFAANEREVSELVFHIARREQIEKKRDNRVREGRKPMSLADIQRYIVSGIPGVSGILADRLLANTHSLQRLFTTDELDLLKVEGIGEVMAKRIRGIATAEYVSATPAEIKNIASRDSLKKLNVDPDAADDGLDIPPPAEE